MKDVIFIPENEYQEMKRKINKYADYFTCEEMEILMQFLMQRQRKSIKNEVKI